MLEWENIFRGKAVNLDVVLSSLYHISPVKESIRHVGPTEISLGHPKPTRKVHTSGEGHQPGMQQSRLLFSSSLIMKESSENMKTISTKNSHPKLLKPTKRSSFMTWLSEPKLGEDKTPYSQTGTSSNTFTLPLSCLMVLNLNMDRDHLQLLDKHNLTFVDDLIHQMDVPIVQPPVNTTISALSVSVKTIQNKTVRQEKERLLKSLQPRYL